MHINIGRAEDGEWSVRLDGHDAAQHIVEQGLSVDFGDHNCPPTGTVKFFAETPDILGRIDKAIRACPCGADPRPGSRYCSADCEPTHIGIHTDQRQSGEGATPMRWRPDLDTTDEGGAGLPEWAALLEARLEQALANQDAALWGGTVFNGQRIKAQTADLLARHASPNLTTPERLASLLPAGDTITGATAAVAARIRVLSSVGYLDGYRLIAGHIT